MGEELRDRDATSTGAAIAVGGVLVNLVCDILFIAGEGAGDVLAAPESAAAFLASTPPDRLAVGTAVGALAIGTWTLATPALRRLVRPAGPRLEWAAAVLHVWFIGGCASFHVATGCLAWAGRLAEPGVVAEVIAPFWRIQQPIMGLTMLSLAAVLGAAVWRGRPRVPRLLPVVSPLVAFSVLAIPTQSLPVPYGAGVAMVASTAGGVGWFACLYVWSRRAE